VNSLLLLLLSVVVVVLGYLLYSKRVDKKIIQSDPNKATPARMFTVITVGLSLVGIWLGTLPAVGGFFESINGGADSHKNAAGTYWRDKGGFRLRCAGVGAGIRARHYRTAHDQTHG